MMHGVWSLHTDLLLVNYVQQDVPWVLMHSQARVWARDELPWRSNGGPP